MSIFDLLPFGRVKDTIGGLIEKVAPPVVNQFLDDTKSFISEKVTEAKDFVTNKPSEFVRNFTEQPPSPVDIMKNVAPAGLKTAGFLAAPAPVQLGLAGLKAKEVADPYILGAMNTEAGKQITGAVQESTSNIPLRAAATAVDTLHGVLSGEWDDKTEQAWLAARNDPNQSALSQFLFNLQDTGFQTTVGVVLSLVPVAGLGLSSTYWTALSAEEQRAKDKNGDGIPDDKVYSTTNLGIDVALDSVLGKSIGSMLKESTKLGYKAVLKNLNKNGLVEGGTEVAQSILKYGNDYVNAKDPAERALIGNEFLSYLQKEMAMEFATAYGSGALIAGGGMALGSPNVNAVTETVNVPVSDADLIREGLEAAKQQAGLTPDIIQEGLAEANATVDQTQNPAVSTALTVTGSNPDFVTPTTGITTAQNVNGHILYNPESPTIAEDIVGAAFEPLYGNFINSQEAISKSYQYEKGALSDEVLEKVKEEMDRRGLTQKNVDAVNKFIQEQIFKSVAYQAISNPSFSKTNPDLYNAFIADVKGGNITQSNTEAIAEIRRRYSTRNFTNAQAQAKLDEDLAIYQSTGKFPSKTLKAMFDKIIADRKTTTDYKRTMGETEKAAREEVRKTFVEKPEESITAKLGTKKVLPKTELVALDLTQAERDIIKDNLEGSETANKDAVYASILKENISAKLLNETADQMVGDLEEKTTNNSNPDKTLKNLSVTKHEVERDAEDFIRTRMSENNIEPEQFQLVRVDAGGSRVSGEPNDLSDLDMRVYYRGTMDEDQVWDNLRDTNWETGEPISGAGEMEGYEDTESGNIANIDFEPVRVSENISPSVETPNAFSFVSPNIDENLTLEMAEDRIDNHRHQYIKKMAQDIDAELNLEAETVSALGDWADGAENTLVTLYKGIDTYEDLRYTVARKALISDQKAAIPFLVDENGADSLFILDFADADIKDVKKLLDENGLEFKTFFKKDGATKVAIFDQDSQLLDNINKIKKYVREINQYKGRGEFLGSWDTRAEGRKIYLEVIRGYENNLESTRRRDSLYGLRRQQFQAIQKEFDGVVSDKYNLQDDELVYETEDYSVFSLGDYLLIKANSNLGFEVLEVFDTVEKGLDFVVIEKQDLGVIREKAAEATANKILDENVINDRISTRMVIKKNTDLRTNDLLTIREKAVLKIRLRAMAKGAKIGWSDARKTLNLAFKTRLEDLKTIRAALVQEIKTLAPEDQAKMIIKLNSITSKGQAAKLERAYIAIRDLKNEAERQDLIYSVKNIAKLVKKKLVTGVGVNHNYVQKMSDLLDDYNINKPTKDTLKKLNELKSYLDSIADTEVKNADGSVSSVPGHAAKMYIPKLEILSKKNIADLSKEELIDLNNTLVELWNIGKALYKEEQLATKERAAENSAMIKNSIVNLDSNAKDEKTRNTIDTLTKVNLDFMHTFRAFNKIDGYQNYNGMAVGIQRQLHSDATRAEDRHNRIIKETFKEIESIVGRNGRITDEEEQAVAFFLYADQEAFDEDGQLIANPQAQSVIDSNNWDGPPQRTERIDAIVSLLRDKLDSIYDELSDVYIRVENKAFPRLKNYFPYYYDRAGNITFEPSASHMRALRKGAKKDFSYSRSKNVQKKVRTDVLSIFSNSMYERLYYIEIQPSLKEIREALNYKEVTEDENGKKTVVTFQDKAGHVVSEYFADFIDIVANRGKKSTFDNSRFIDAVRQNVSYAVMGYNLTSALMQPLAIADATIWTGVTRGLPAATRMAARFAANFLNPRFASKIKAKSAVLRNRQGGEFAFADISPKQTGKGLLGNAYVNSINFLRQYAYEFIKKPDIQTASIVQDSIYRDLKNSSTVELSEREARKEAEFVMNLVSGSADVVDRPLALGKSQINRLILTFQTFILNRFGMVGEDLIMQGVIHGGNTKASLRTLHSIPRKKLSSILAALIGFLMISMASAFENIYRREIRKALFKKEDKETDFWSDTVFAYAEMIPFLGGIVSDVRAKRQVGASVDLPTLSFLADMANGIGKLQSDVQDTKDKGLLLIGKSIATLLGVPGTNFGANLTSQFMTEQKQIKGPSIKSRAKSSSSPVPKRTARPKRPARPGVSD